MIDFYRLQLVLLLAFLFTSVKAQQEMVVFADNYEDARLSLEKCCNTYVKKYGKKKDIDMSKLSKMKIDSSRDGNLLPVVKEGAGGEMAGLYCNFFAVYGKQKWMFVYDVLHEKVLGIDDIYKESSAKWIHEKFSNGISFFKMSITKGYYGKTYTSEERAAFAAEYSGIMYGNFPDSLTTSRFSVNRKLFTPQFIELIDQILANIK